MGKTWRKRPSSEEKRIHGAAPKRTKNKKGYREYTKNPDDDFFDLRGAERKDRAK